MWTGNHEKLRTSMNLIRNIKQAFLPLALVAGVLALPGSAPVQSVEVDNWAAARVSHLEAEIGTPLPSTIGELLDFANIPEEVDKQNYCLAQAIYFEARGESIDGQFAVARVVLNRVRNENYPGTICGVVFQNQNWVDACQFSFACDGTPDSPKERAAWAMARRIANLAQADLLPDTSGEATHYHADYVNPRWSKVLKQTAQVGRHIFYRYEDAE